MSHEDVIGADWCPTGHLVMILYDKIQNLLGGGGCHTKM